MKFYLFAIIVIILVSCKTKVDVAEQIKGSWEIDTIGLDNNPDPIPLFRNVIMFSANDSCELPAYDVNTSKEHGYWSVIRYNDKYILNISSENDLFDGNFTIKKIWYGYNKKANMNKHMIEFTSNHVYMVLRKVW